MKSRSFQEIVDKINYAEEYTVFMLGDSITQGCGASSAETCYTSEFARLLAKRYVERTVLRYDGKVVDELLPLNGYTEAVEVQKGSGKEKLTVVRCGVGGNTVRRLLNRKDDYAGREMDGRKADLFFLMVGINDSLVKNPAKYVTPEQYKKDLCELLDLLARTNPEADVVLMTPTYYHDGSTPDSYLDLYAEKMIEVAEEQGLPLIDLHKMWMDHMVIGGEGYGQGDWLPHDKCHPGDKGHRLLAEEIVHQLFS